MACLLRREDFLAAKKLTSEAAKSGSWFYPIKGIIYFVSHRSLWKPLLSKLVPTVTLSVGVVSVMFFITYVPQLAVLVWFNGPIAAFTTALLVLSESSTIVGLVTRSWLLQDALLDTFDGTLVSSNQQEIVAVGRQLQGGRDPIEKLGRVLKSPFQKFTPAALLRYVIYLPLNFIPLVGTALFVMLQGRTRGNSIHGRYYQLKKWTPAETEDWLKTHRGPYTAFGVVATLLEMIPVASIFFSFTNAVGAALWAADIESKGTAMTKGTAPGLRDAAKKAE